MTINEKHRQAYQRAAEARKILLITHNKPDGDALSSICAMIDLVIGLDKEYFAYCYDAPPFQFSYLPHIEEINYHKEELDFASFDLVIVLDCGSLGRTMLASEISNRSPDQFIIEFDHHPKIDDFADLEVRLPSSSSTVEVLYDFFKVNRVKLTKNLANCILTGILTDTGNFLYPSTSDKTIQIGSEMLVYGARFPTIIESTWRNKSLAGMKFWGRAINNLKVNSRYNFAFSVLTRDDIMSSGVSDEEFEGIAGFLSNLSGVDGLLILREEEGGMLKGSLRTANPKIDISRLARLLGGGGHPKASGFMVEGRLEQTDGGWRVC